MVTSLSRPACLRRPRGHRASGFTLLEVLVSIAIIFVLITIALVALHSARKSAGKSVTLNALRQIMVAYNGYGSEHNGRLLPGYINPLNLGTNPATQLDITAKLPGRTALSAADTAGYVWRLAPYLDHGWQVFLADYSKTLQQRFAEEFATGVYGPGTASGTANPPQLGIGFLPSIGYNSIYLGGDNVHGDGMVPQYSPWETPNPNEPNNVNIAVTRVSQIINPPQLIAFAACKAVNMTLPEVHEQLGYVEVRAPWVPGANPGLCDQPQWIVDENNQLQPNPANFNGPGGLMVDRDGGDKVPCAMMDGSSVIHNYHEYMLDSGLSGLAAQIAINRQMAHWAPVYRNPD